MVGSAVGHKYIIMLPPEPRRLASLDHFVGVTNLESIILLGVKEPAHWSDLDSEFQVSEAHGPQRRHYRGGGGTSDSYSEEQTLHTAQLTHKPRTLIRFQCSSSLVLVLFISFSMILSDVWWVRVIVADNKSISEVYNFGDERALSGFIIQMRQQAKRDRGVQGQLTSYITLWN
jgi:hypothetical protein